MSEELSEKTLDELISELHSMFNGDRSHDMRILKEFDESHQNHPQSEELKREIGRCWYQLLSDEERREATQAFEHDLSALSQRIDESLRLANEHKTDEAIALLEPVIHLLEDIFGHQGQRQTLTFATPFDELIYRRRTNMQDEIPSVPFNLSRIYFLYGEMLQEKAEKSQEDSQPEEMRAARQASCDAHLKSMEYNPVDAENLLHLSYCCRLLDDPEGYEKYTRLAHSCCYLREHLAICYGDFAMIFLERGDADFAALLFRYAEHYEKTYRARKMIEFLEAENQKKYPEPTLEEVEAACAAHGVPFGPDAEILSIAEQFASLTAEKMPGFSKLLSETVSSLKQVHEEFGTRN